MLKFIEAELAKRRGAAGGGGAAAAPLRDAPEEQRAGKRRDEDGADRWLAGIEEVQLPVEYKLKARPPSSALPLRLCGLCLPSRLICAAEHRGYGARQDGVAAASADWCSRGGAPGGHRRGLCALCPYPG